MLQKAGKRTIHLGYDEYDDWDDWQSFPHNNEVMLVTTEFPTIIYLHNPSKGMFIVLAVKQKLNNLSELTDKTLIFLPVVPNMYYYSSIHMPCLGSRIDISKQSIEFLANYFMSSTFSDGNYEKLADDMKKNGIGFKPVVRVAMFGQTKQIKTFKELKKHLKCT